jgi:hypothetical protein
MSDRGFLFLFSVLVVLASLGAAGWLLASGQAGSVDGLFLLLTCLVVAAAFGLYIGFMIKRAIASATEAAPQTAKAAAGNTAKSSPSPVAQAQ